jgi:hypothetical protein
MVSRICSIVVGMLMDRGISDYSNGYRFYNRRAAQLIATHGISYTSPIYLTEVMALWLRSGMRHSRFPYHLRWATRGVVEAAVHRPRKGGLLHLRDRESLSRERLRGEGPRRLGRGHRSAGVRRDKRSLTRPLRKPGYDGIRSLRNPARFGPYRERCGPSVTASYTATFAKPR